MTVVIAIVGLLVGSSIVAMLWLSLVALLRRFTRRRLEGQAERLRKLLESSRRQQYKGLDKLLFDMRDTFDPQVLDEQMQKELGKGSAVDKRLIAAVDRLGLAERYLVAVREATGWRARAQAAHALGALGEIRAAEPLVATMRDPREDSDVKLAAAEALGRIHDPAVVPLLCEQLGDVDEWSSPRIAAILTSFGSVATEPLLAALDHGESLNARVWAAQILGKIGARSAVAPLRDRLHDRSEQMRLSAANALGDISDVRAVRSLIDVALRDPTPAVRAQAAQALGKLGDPEALPILVAALGDPEYWMRFRALEAIEQLKPGNIETIELALGDASPEVRRRAALALERLGLLDQAFLALDNDDDAAAVARERLTAVGRAGLSERFIRHLNDEAATVRENTAKILGDVGDPSHAGELERRLADDVPAVRRAAARALGSLAVESTAPALIALLDDGDTELASAAVESLLRFGGSRLTPHTALLAQMLASESDRARVRAAEVLAEVPGDEVDELLLGRGLGDRFVEVRLAAVRGLGRRQVREAVDAIGALLSDAYEPLRVSAAVALSEIGGDRGVDLLLARMARAGRAQREAICRGIAALGFDDLGGALDILLGDTDVNARIGATWVLGNTGAVDSVPLLAALLVDSEARVRSSAAGALSKIPDAESFAVLRDSHDDPNQFVRAAVVNAIGGRGGVSDLAILTARAGDPDAYVRNRAVISMGRIGGDDAWNRIRAAAERSDPPQRVLALGLSAVPQAIGDAVSALENPRLRAEVAELLAAESPEVREQFVANLGLTQIPDSLRDAFAASLEPSPVIAKLVSDLRNDNLIDARLTALRTLARLKTRAATVALAAAARHDPSPGVRVAAIAALAERTSNPEAIAVLASAVADPADEVRAQALRAVGDSGDRSHAKVVLESLGSPRATVGEAAIEASAKLYSNDVAGFLSWLVGNDRPQVVAAGLSVLAAIADDAALEVVVSHSTSPDPRVRVAAIAALAALSDVQASRALIERISDPDPNVRRVAIASAPRSGETLIALRAACADPDNVVRAACAAKLRESETLEAIELLLQLAADPAADVAASALAALLAGRSSEARRAFVRGAKTSSSEALARAYRDEGAAVAVVSAEVAGALSAEKRMLAIEVLLGIGRLELADDIADGLADPDPSVRLSAARALAEIGVDKLEDRLRELTSDPVADVRAEVRRLLIRSV